MTATMQTNPIAKIKILRYLFLYFPGTIRNKIILFIRRSDGFEHISVQETKQKMDKGELVILDIRMQESRNNGYIEGSLFIEAHNIKNNLHLLPKNKIIAVMCWGGGLSQTITRILISKGFNNAMNLEGGILKWGEEIDEEMLKCIW